MHNDNLTSKSVLTFIAGVGMVAVVSGCNSSGGSGSASTVAEATTSGSSSTGSSGGGSTDSTDGSSSTATPTVATTAEDTLTKSADENTILSANGVTLIRSKTPVTRDTTPITLKIVDDSVEVSALGVSRSFTKADKRLVGDDEQVIYETDNGWVNIDGRSGEDINNGNTVHNYMTPIVGGTETVEDGRFDRFYGVVGLETPSDVIAKKANASYSGRFNTISFQTTNPSGDAQSSDEGDVALQADFAQSKINGNITFDTDDNELLKFNLNEADITGNSFATTFALKDNDGGGTGDFAGKFFGDNAQEAGGTISYDYTDDVRSDVDVAAGTWTATEDASD